MQGMFDGDQHVGLDQTQQHLHNCIECREWKSDMDALLSSISFNISELPEIDISAAIMSQLPKRHPAAPVKAGWSLNRTLAWALACWFAGMLVLVGGVGIWMLATGNDGLGLVSGVCKAGTSLLRWTVSEIGVITIAFKALSHAAGLLISQLWEVACRIKWTLLILFGLDIFLLVAGYTVLRRRVLSGSMMVV